MSTLKAIAKQLLHRFFPRELHQPLPTQITDLQEVNPTPEGITVLG
jgi:hypothetical protein